MLECKNTAQDLIIEVKYGREATKEDVDSIAHLLFSWWKRGLKTRLMKPDNENQRELRNPENEKD